MSKRLFIGLGGLAVSEGTPTKKGYFRLKTAEHRDQYEHRVALEKKLRRKLKPSEDTHHRNRNRADTRPENLTPVKHARHPKVTFGRKKP